MTTSLPGVGWLFIHQVQLIHRTADGGDGVVDDEGRWVLAEATPQDVTGYLAVTGRAELELAQSLGVRIDAVFACARDQPAAEADEIVATGIDPYLDGRYSITAVRPTPVHLRLLLQRTVDQRPR